MSESSHLGADKDSTKKLADGSREHRLLEGERLGGDRGCKRVGNLRRDSKSISLEQSKIVEP